MMQPDRRMTTAGKNALFLPTPYGVMRPQWVNVHVLSSIQVPDNHGHYSHINGAFPGIIPANESFVLPSDCYNQDNIHVYSSDELLRMQWW